MACTAVVLVVSLASGCSLLRSEEGGDAGRIDLIAVAPIRESPTRGEPGDRPTLETHAGRAVTAQIYGYLAEQTRFRVVPDLSVDAFIEQLDTRDRVEVARAVAKEFAADAVLVGSVYRFRDRVGPRYAASQPASVSFELALYSAAADELIWRGEFDETQEPLSSNIFKAWMFWRAGPHWFSSRELTRLGVEDLLGDLPDRPPVRPAGEEQ